jgi:hypothetical protein
MLRHMRPRDFGARFIAPSLSGNIGAAFPESGFPCPMVEPQRTGMAEASTETLKAVFRKKANWKAMANAANALGQRVDRLTDIEALGYIARFCEDDSARAIAMGKLVSRISEVRDSRVLEAIVMNSGDDMAQRRAIDMLGRRTENVTSSFTLVHIALRAKQKNARLAAATKLRGNGDSLNVVAQHSEFQDTREYAQALLQRPEK